MLKILSSLDLVGVSTNNFLDIIYICIIDNTLYLISFIYSYMYIYTRHINNPKFTDAGISISLSLPNWECTNKPNLTSTKQPYPYKT